MKSILTTIIIATTFLLCSCPKCKDCNGGNTTIDTTTQTTVEVKDTLPSYIHLNEIDMDGYPNYTCESMPLDTTSPLCVCPVVVNDTASDMSELFVIVSLNRKDMLYIGICNIVLDGVQYPSEWEGTILKEGYKEIQLFSLDVKYDDVKIAEKVSFAFWGDYGSVIITLDERQRDEFKYLVKINKNGGH